MNRNGLLALVASAVVGLGVTVGVIVSGIFGSTGGGYGAPSTPQPYAANGELQAHFDVQVHNRDVATVGFGLWDQVMDAQHGADCAGPPAIHPLQQLSQAAFVCKDHVMTAGWANGYGEVILTPSQILNCSAGCSVTWDMSTERMSVRDWPDVWLTPWSDNLALPFDAGDVDLQGVPRQGIHADAPFNQSSWIVTTIANYQVTNLPFDQYYGMGQDVTPGTNQSAQRQTFKLTVTPGHVKMERLASATAPQHTWVDADCACLLAPDYVVQFGHHIYNPTKDGAGVPATWHWFGTSSPVLTPTTPFTIIHMNPQCTGCTAPFFVTANNSTVTFQAPAPANSFLRFSGYCQVFTDAQTPGTMALAPKQTFIGHFEHASSYWIPIGQGRTSVQIGFAADGGYPGPCAAQDFHIWSKTGGPAPTPTLVPTLTPVVPTPPPNATPTPVVPPTATITPTPRPTSTVIPTPALPTSTPTGKLQLCTLRWGNGTIETYGNLTQQGCADRGQ